MHLGRAGPQDLELAQNELKERFATSSQDLEGIMKQLRESLGEFEEKSNQEFGDTSRMTTWNLRWLLTLTQKF